MKISINAGHTLSGPGTGASYNGLRESLITREVVKALKKKLQAKGHTVHDSTVDYATSQTAYLKKACTLANNAKVDLFLSIHCNASASRLGHGVECYTYKNAKHKEAINICKNIEALGFRNRGVKDGTQLYVVRNTTAKAILVELFFLDNNTDRNLYWKNGADKLASAIAKSI